MKTLKFKTNINCGGCISTVTPFLNSVRGISNWKVATDTKDKILIVEGEDLESESVEQAVRDAGFNIEKVKKGLFY
ncbi:MAG: heavy-metal-associated domain-containing protein [Bacteroidota bacterium]|nr:heavy-metal-associated domain-containing protein [Bacteroidota bacterium]